ncbi:MAG: paraquat-inducible protein A [Pseudomonadota bacterium]
MSQSNLFRLAIASLLLALLLLVPGVTQPFLKLTGSVDRAELVEYGKLILAEHPDVPQLLAAMSAQILDNLTLDGEMLAFEKTRSIVGAVDELFRADRHLVAILIVTFSIIVPLVKSFLLLYVAVRRNHSSANNAEALSHAVSQWSMADVFAVAILVAFLASNATQSTEQLFSLSAELQDGFYYFLGYCLLSILASQLLRVAWRRRQQVS